MVLLLQQILAVPLDGWIDEDETWHGGRRQPRPHSLDGDPAPPQKGHSPSPNFRPCLLWPNGWMDQDAIWYCGRPQPRPHCVRWEPSPPKGHSPQQFSAHVCCGHTAGWIQMPLGTEIGLSPGHIVLDGHPAPPRKGVGPSSPSLSQLRVRRQACIRMNGGPCLLWPNGTMDQDTTWYGGMPRLRRHCVSLL